MQPNDPQSQGQASAPQAELEQFQPAYGPQQAPTQPQSAEQVPAPRPEVQPYPVPEQQLQPEPQETTQATVDRRTPLVTMSYGNMNAQVASNTAQPSGEPVRWSAPEYIAPEKNILWYVALGILVAGAIVLDFFVIRAITPSVLAVAIAAALIVMSVRPARTINYTLSEQGLYMGEQLIDLTQYKAFGIIHDGKENSIFLIPNQRLKPGLSVYFPVESGEQIVDSLGTRLPMQEIRLDFVDRIVKFLRL